MKLIDVSVLKEWVENWFTKNRLYHPYAKNNNIPITELYDILEQMPSAQPERLTDDDFETIRIHLNIYKEKLYNQHRWKEADEYQRIIDRFMAFASAQPEKRTEKRTETHACDLISRQSVLKAIDEYERLSAVSQTVRNMTSLREIVQWLPSTQPEPCEDAVSRSEIIRLILERGLYCDTQADRETSAEIIRQLPSVQPERKKGKWIPVTNGRGGFECEKCHHYAPSYQDGVEWLSDYCPSCGIDMREESDNERIPV